MTSIINERDKKIIVGLDIGSSNVTCAIANYNSSNKNIKLQGISSTTSYGIKKGIITNRDRLIELLDKVISEAELMANTKVNNVIMSITGEYIRSLNTQAAIPLNRPNNSNYAQADKPINNEDVYQVLELAQAISLPADRDILHTLPQEYLIDTLDEIKNPLGMSGRRLEGRVHLVTAATTAMNNLVNCVEELGINVNGLVFQPLAAGLATLQEDEMELGVTLVEIGSSTTNIAVYNSGAVRHSAVIPIGSSSITNDIAVMLQISIDEAEQIKMKYASAQSSMSSSKLDISLSSEDGKLKRSIPEQEISKYVEARMQEIFHLVIREISRADIKDPLTYGIVLTGGGAGLRNISKLAEHSIGVKVRKGKSLKIEGVQDIADESRYCTVLGLLLWPLYSNDHIRMQKPSNRSFKKILEKIRHTIEDIF